VDDWQEDGCFHYTGEGSDRKSKTFALVFDTGEEVVAGLLQFAKDPKLSGAHLTAIGAFERITLGFFDVTKKDYKRIAIQEQVELMSSATSPRTTRAIRSSMLILSSASRTAPRTAVTCWIPKFDRPWKSCLSKRRNICTARCAGEFGLALLDLS
jgi:Plants and Prokaryotes Conserved (PCC) domain